jgi:hypothetical protein
LGLELNLFWKLPLPNMDTHSILLSDYTDIWLPMFGLPPLIRNSTLSPTTPSNVCTAYPLCGIWDLRHFFRRDRPHWRGLRLPILHLPHFPLLLRFPAYIVKNRPVTILFKNKLFKKMYNSLYLIFVFTKSTTLYHSFLSNLHGWIWLMCFLQTLPTAQINLAIK